MKRTTLRKKCILAVAGLLLVLLILKVTLFLTAKPKITVDYVAEHNQTSLPDNYEHTENAAQFYQKAFDVYVEMPEELQKPMIEWPAGFEEAEQGILKEWLISNSQAFEYFQKAVDKPYYWLERKSDKDNTVAGIMLPELDPLRKLTRALLWDAKIRTVSGQFRLAFEAILSCYRAGKHKCGPNLLLMEQHNGLMIKDEAISGAFTILRNSRVEGKALEFLQKALRTELNSDHYMPAIEAEKYFIYDALQRTFIDDGKGTGRWAWSSGWYVEPYADLSNTSLKESRLKKCLMGSTRNEIIEQTNEVLQISKELMLLTPWQVVSRDTSYFEQINTINKSTFFLQIFGVNPERIFHKYHETKTRTEALIATLAVLRFKVDNDQLPKSLDKLVSEGYLQALPDDPYSDSCLVYKLTGDDFNLYSVGANLEDDNGTIGLDIEYWPTCLFGNHCAIGSVVR